MNLFHKDGSVLSIIHTKSYFKKYQNQANFLQYKRYNSVWRFPQTNSTPTDSWSCISWSFQSLLDRFWKLFIYINCSQPKDSCRMSCEQSKIIDYICSISHSILMMVCKYFGKRQWLYHKIWKIVTWLIKPVPSKG